MSARMDALIGHDYSVRRFAELAPHYQLAIVWRTVMECDGWQDVLRLNGRTRMTRKLGWLR